MGHPKAPSVRDKKLHLHVTEKLERCTGCSRVIGGETLTLADDETGEVVRCPECSKAPLL